MLLQDHQLDKDVKKALTVTFCVNTAINKNVNDKGVNEIVDGNEENKEIIDIKEFSDKFSDNSFSTLLQQIIPASIKDREDEIDKTKKKSLQELFKKGYEVIKEIIDAKARGLWKLPTALTKKGIRLSMGDLKIKSKQLYIKNRIYVPENKPLQLFLLQQHHNPSIYGYLEYKTIYQKIQERYF